MSNADFNVLARARLAVRGAVQGVGFRPCVFRLATELGLSGWVNNSGEGVLIDLEGSALQIRGFIVRLEGERPPRSFIQSLETSWLDPLGVSGFEIRASDSGAIKTALVLPDIATCPDCLSEIRDPSNRRFRYPFTNCTHCGPRFSIIEALPYDRANTSMRHFDLCPECRAEYEDPTDRRFHAQPNACPACGPHLELWACDGRLLSARDDALKSAADELRAGAVVAMKGLGGFQLLVDARNQEAVRRLRALKGREEKPLAILAPSPDWVRAECELSELEQRLINSPEAPIVLLRRRGLGSVAAAVAPGNPFLGVMLPYTPLHHLLLAQLGFPIVATSGNRSDEPICISERDALSRLGGIADVFLVHNRPIVRHVDDSVARVVLDRELVLRRARGYAPLPVLLKQSVPPILAVGAHLKNAVALSVGQAVFVSQHIGDLETTASLAAFRAVIGDFKRIYETEPKLIAADAHPDYLSTKFAVETAAESGTQLVRVQHHYAHILSCLAENEIEGPALGVAWDGTGWGPDGTVWGGEFLKITEHGFVRLAHLRTFGLPGGEMAVKEPRRSALGVLYELFGDEAFEMVDLPTLRAFTYKELAALRKMLARRINAPRTSSAGRLFDAVASLAGLRQVTAFEGQGAMELEWACAKSKTAERPALPGDPGSDLDASPLAVDWAPMIRGIIDQVSRGEAVAEIAARFHDALVEMIVTMAHRAGEPRVALSGGCFQNEYLLRRAVQRLRAEGFQPIWHQRVPTNDGGIALGQVFAAGRFL